MLLGQHLDRACLQWIVLSYEKPNTNVVSDAFLALHPSFPQSQPSFLTPIMLRIIPDSDATTPDELSDSETPVVIPDSDDSMTDNMSDHDFTMSDDISEFNSTMSDDMSDSDTRMDEETPLSDPNIMDVMLSRTWTCLCAPAYKHPLYHTVFPDFETLSTMASRASIVFPKQLFGVIDQDLPPDIEFFRRLPDPKRRVWGVYVLIMEKPGQVPLIYIGSGTHGSQGVMNRLRGHDQGHVRPMFVEQAARCGYNISRMSLLAWSPIPPAGILPRVRLLFVAFEAVFSFLFWAMHSRKKDYNMGSHCPWPRDSFQYGGLCSHNALHEGCLGDFSLTEEELEEVHTKKQAHIKEYLREWGRNRPKRNPYHKATDAASLRAMMDHQNSVKTAWRKANPERYKQIQHSHVARRMADKKFFCETCDATFVRPRDLSAHFRSKRHKLNADRKRDGTQLPWKCVPCGSRFKFKCYLESHKKSTRHKKRQELFEASASS